MTYPLATILKAVASNQVARFAPGLYVRLTGQTGRGDRDSETTAEIASYFRQCVTDYAEVLGIPFGELSEFLRDKVVLEYGPGDVPGVAFLLVAFGARKVYCADRFPLVRIEHKNVDVLKRMEDLLDDSQRERFYSCFKNPHIPEQGLNSDRIEYLVRSSGLSGLHQKADLVLSRAVLEHVNDLVATFKDMLNAMQPGATAIHKVDLRSHGLHVSNPLDFLSAPRWLWGVMHSYKGVPNRWRADCYDRIMKRLGLEAAVFRPTALFAPETVHAVRPSLAASFAAVPDDLLAWQGFWLVFSKRADAEKR